MRILHVGFFSFACWLSLDAWSYMKQAATITPDATWLVGAMPAFIIANISGLWAMVAEARKSHKGDE